MSGSPIWDRWDEVDALLEQVLDRPVSERDAHLVDACADDVELLEAVRALAHSSEAAELLTPGPDLLKAALTDVGGEAPEAPEAMLGMLVGPYRLISILGVGGMGVVYLAERSDGVFERRVAVKVLRRALSTPGVLERFRMERQILASLNHPGIAQLIDGGVTPEGRPYLVMEHVDGVPIDRYVGERDLGVPECVRLTIRVADAVDYAHRHMVIHRDLKPSNILVTEGGGVKLLDFGIAKLLEAPEGDEVPLATRPEARFVTPEYAAPEQLLGEAVSTQTDVFALGGLLYQLLTGLRPYSNREPGSVLERMIRGDEPTAPSDAVALGEAGEGREVLRRRLSGDLDAILLRALRTRPEERYGSVAAFREDLEHHLAGRAVGARGDAKMYRTRRFVYRHRVSVAAVAIVFLVSLGSAVGLALQRAAVVEERNRATVAAEAARHEAETARQVTAFLVGLFEGSDPRETRGDTLSVSALLGRGTERVETELAGQPAIRAELLATLGQVYGNLGNFEEAVRLVSRAVALHRDSLPDPSGLAASLLILGDLHINERHFAEAVANYRAAREAGAEMGDDRAVGAADLGLGGAFTQLDEPDSAEFHLSAGLRRVATVADYPQANYLNALVNLAGLVRRRGELAGAEDLYRQVADLQRRSPDTDPVALALTLNNLAVLRRMQGALDDAEVLYREAVDTLTSVLGAGHPTALMMTGNLARVFEETGRADEAIALYRDRIDAARVQWPEGHWRTAQALMFFGGALVKNGRAPEAIEPLSEALDLMIEQVGSQHSWTNVYRGWLGTAAVLTGRTEGGDQLFAWSLDGLSQYPELAQDRQVINMLGALVEVMEARGLNERAARYRALVDLGP